MLTLLMFIIVIAVIFLFIILVLAVSDNGFSGMVEDVLKSLDMIREYRKGKRKRKKEG